MALPRRHSSDELTDNDHIKIQREVAYMKRRRRDDLKHQIRHGTSFTFGRSVFLATSATWLFGPRPAAIQLATLYEKDYQKLVVIYMCVYDTFLA